VIILHARLFLIRETSEVSKNRDYPEVLRRYVLPYFEQTELHQSPFLDERYGLDRGQFKPVLDKFYALHGWDTESGWPTQERLRELALEDVYEPMINSAVKAREVNRSRD
jgi:hypothetical protein